MGYDANFVASSGIKEIIYICRDREYIMDYNTKLPPL